MDFHPSHPLQPFWNMAVAPVQVQALEQALALQLFDQLNAAASAGQIAQRLQLQPQSTAVWLDVLWAMGLLERQRAMPQGDACYRATALAERYFCHASAHWCGEAWRMRAHHFAQLAGQWQPLLRNGSAAEALSGAPSGGAPSDSTLPPVLAALAAPPAGGWAQAARAQISQEQRAISAEAALRVLDALPPLASAGHFVDLGGGPGHIALALARRLPGWTGSLCEQGETVEVARSQFEAAGLTGRLDVQACDLDRQPVTVAHGCDLLWCSSVLHFLHDPAQAVHKMRDALRPGGWLLLAHAEQPQEVQLAAQVLPFYAGLLLRGQYLPAPGEVAQWMADAGLVDVRALGPVGFPMAPVWVYAARQACR